MANPAAEPTSDLPEVFATEAPQGVTEVDADAGTHAEPQALMLEPYQWVSVAMLFLIGLFIWKKVPQAVTGGLDARIEAIKQNLDEAKTLRAEAEALRDEYSAKIANAEKDAEAMIENAQREAEAIVAKAEDDTAATIARRKAMAEDKIAAAERAAVDDVRDTVAKAAAAASRSLIAEKHDAKADNALVDETIAKL